MERRFSKVGYGANAKPSIWPMTLTRLKQIAELILRRDTRIAVLLKKFEVQNSGDSSFLESLHELISKNDSGHSVCGIRWDSP